LASPRTIGAKLARFSTQFCQTRAVTKQPHSHLWNSYDLKSISMPDFKWLKKIAHREERARDEATCSAAPNQLDSPALQGSTHSLPISSSESTLPSLTTANPMSVPSASVKSNNLPQPATSHYNSSAIQKGDNFGIRVLYEPSDKSAAIVDIIFVHGLTGNAYDTWLHEGRQTHWPSQLVKEDIPDARVLSFGYDADVVCWFSAASDNRISNHAEALLPCSDRVYVSLLGQAFDLLYRLRQRSRESSSP
jgi:hypothetical protein